ncbi:MAG: hypothetical protein EZS28_006746 [Streblomastix strix]|uniref:Uncharacterized protein n=1 Tax=Streblomastix strix TaxID=222440 RepID=A0A5J4WS35_9EUKA|nr:MAG: hypothetical protein EZS28_006746 [Streblomastix strix]
MDIQKIVLKDLTDFTGNDDEKQLSDIRNQLDSLRFKFLSNFTHISAEIYSPQLIPSLINLLKYKAGEYINIKNKGLASQIRNNSKQCLELIQRCGDIQEQVQLCDSGLAISLSVVIGIAGGSCIEEQFEVFNLLQLLNNFIYILKNGKQKDDYHEEYPNFICKPEMTRTVEEQIEFEGGNEEVEALIYNKEGYYGNVKIYAKLTKETIQLIQCNYHMDIISISRNSSTDNIYNNIENNIEDNIEDESSTF